MKQITTRLMVAAGMLAASAAEEQILIDNWFGDILYGQPWLGGFRTPDSDPVTGWQWITGETWSYTNWLAGEPNDAGAAAPKSSGVAHSRFRSQRFGTAPPPAPHYARRTFTPCPFFIAEPIV